MLWLARNRPDVAEKTWKYLLVPEYLALKLTGNAGGTINGSLINLHDTEFMMTGNSHLTINHDGMDDDPAGIEFPRQLTYVAGSYSE